METLQVSDVFRSCQFVVDFAASSLLSFKRKKEIRRDIVDNGGILSYILTKQVGRRITSVAANYKIDIEIKDTICPTKILTDFLLLSDNPLLQNQSFHLLVTGLFK